MDVLAPLSEYTRRVTWLTVTRVPEQMLASFS